MPIVRFENREKNQRLHSGKQGKCSTFASPQAMPFLQNCKKLVEGPAPSSGACRPALAENDPPDHFPGATGPPKTRTAFCGCSIFLRQMRFRQWADMKETVMSDSCVLHAILAWRLSLFVKITTALVLVNPCLGRSIQQAFPRLV